MDCDVCASSTDTYCCACTLTVNLQPLADIWKKATDSTGASLQSVPLIVKREAFDELIKVLYLSATERRGAHNEYVVTKKHGMVFVDSKPGFYKLQEWAFGRDVVDHAVEAAFIEDSSVKMYNVVLVCSLLGHCRLMCTARANHCCLCIASFLFCFVDVP
jgi:hypothetical protein